MAATFTECAQAGNIAYIHGDVSRTGQIPSGSAAPYDQMLLTSTGNSGMSEFKARVENEGHTISQYYDANTALDATFLDQFDTVIFGLHQKIWSPSEKDALDLWIRSGGGILMYSDSAAGGHYGQVGADNPTGQSAVNNIIQAYGMEVTVDQTGGEQAYRSIENPTHLILPDVKIFEGEGVSPIAVNPDSDVEILIPYTSEYKVFGSGKLNNFSGITIADPSWAALAITDVGQGHVMVSFDRQPMWNEHSKTDIDDSDNSEILMSIVNFLAAAEEQPDEPVDLSVRSDALVTTAGVAWLRSESNAQSFEWSVVSGPGSVTINDASAATTQATFSSPGFYTLELTASNGSESGSASVEVEVVDPFSVVHALNCGSTGLVATTGIVYSEDNYYTNLTSRNRVDNLGETPITGTENHVLYNRARTQMASYNLPVANGNYTVLLQFTETYWSGVNRRIFDIRVEGDLAEERLDLYAAAPGKLNAFDLLFEAQVTDGVLDLDFNASKNNSLISGLVVVANEPAHLIGGKLQVEDFDDGESGVAYFDRSSANKGGEYRDTSVDIGAIANTTEEYFVGWIQNREYLNYTVDVVNEGFYDVTFRLASARFEDKSFALKLNDEVLTGVVTTNTGGAGWQVWQDVTVSDIYLPAGRGQKLTLEFLSSSINFDSIDFQLQPEPSYYAINVGGDEYLDADTGTIYEADNPTFGVGFEGAPTSIVTTSREITETNDDLLYQTRREAEDGFGWDYQVPVENGVYTVTLKFASFGNGLDETDENNGSYFPLRIEGTGLEYVFLSDGDGVQDAFDYVRADVEVTDGVLEVELNRSYGGAPYLNAILIESQ